MWKLIRRTAQRPPRPLNVFWRNWLLSSAARLLRKEGVERFVCYDIGARWGVWPEFRKLPLPIYKIGFEADPDEAARLQRSGEFDVVVPFALSGTGGLKMLHLGREPGCSSLYGPDLELIERHCAARSNFEVVKQIPLNTITLQQAITEFKLPQPDFIKLDVEGAELEILCGAGAVLEQCAGILFEARLAPFYRGEPLFGGVAAKLFEQGFSITSFESLPSFEGAIMLVDASACRNLRVETRRQQILKSAAFALLVENFEFALASLRKTASKKEILFG